MKILFTTLFLGFFAGLSGARRTLRFGLDHAADIDLPGLDHEQAIELKLDGTKDEELYRLLLPAQCNALHQAMPFLFEKLADETELLLPANLLQAQRDYFGAHTYERTDREGTFHTDWP